MKHFATLISVLAFTNGADCILADDFVIDFTSEPNGPLLFFFKNNGNDFETSINLCETFNGRLPNSVDELKKYTLNNQNFALKGKNFWIGISKSSNGLYKWQDGRYIEYGKFDQIRSYWNGSSNCATICCGLTADPGDFNIIEYGKEKKISLNEAPCTSKQSTACLVESPQSILFNKITPSLREFNSIRYDLANADSLLKDYTLLKKSIQNLRKPLQSLQEEIENLDKKISTSKPPSNSSPVKSSIYVGSKGSFKETVDLCKKVSGKVITVSNEDENIKLTKLAGKTEFWVDSIKKNGKYYNSNGSEIKYTPWMDGKPDCDDDEPCCLAYSTWDSGNKGELFDAPCDSNFNQFCSIETKEETPKEEKVRELSLLTSQAAKQDVILMKLVSMLSQLSSAFSG